MLFDINKTVQRLQGIWESHITTRATGLLLVFCAGLFYTLSNSIVQYICEETSHHAIQLSVFEIVFARCVVQMVFVCVLLVVLKKKPLGDDGLKTLFYLIPMGLAEVSNIIFFYMALRYMHVSKVTVVLATVPIFTTMFSFPIFKSKCSLYIIIFSIMSMAGVMFIACPTLLLHSSNITTTTHHRELSTTNTSKSHYTVHAIHSNLVEANILTHKTLMGVTFALLSSISASLYVVLSKFTGMKSSILLTSFYPSLFGIILSPFFIMATHREFLLDDVKIKLWLLLVVVGVLCVLGAVTMTKGLTFEDAGVAVVMRNCDVISAFIFQYLFLGFAPSVYGIIGAFIVIVPSTMILVDREFDIDEKYLCTRWHKTCLEYKQNEECGKNEDIPLIDDTGNVLGDDEEQD